MNPKLAYWLQVSLEACDLDPELLSAFFETAGALSVTYQDAADQPLYEPAPGAIPLWSSTRIVALFDHATDMDHLRQVLAAAFGTGAVRRLLVERLADRDWEHVWLEDFRPMQFGQRLWICPAGMRPEGGSDQVIVDLDPGLAFGTGTHPTTRLCLEWLDAHPPAHRQVLDYGCGSGVLGIAALKLGAKRVVAVDLDPQALLATRENAIRNGVGERLETLQPRVALEPTELLLANILANPLVELAERFAGLSRQGGHLVLSGILANQVETLVAAYSPAFVLDPAVTQDGWALISGRRR